MSASTISTADHPLLDAAGAGWAATETRADVVALSTGLSDFLGRVAAEGRRPILVSGEFSRITQPLSETLAAVGGHWVVRTPDAGCYEALTGAPLASPEDVFRLPRRDGVHPAFLRTAVANRMQLVLSVSTRHRTTRPVRLGGALEAAAEVVSGAPPAAWGAVEPLLAPWDRDDLTERSRRRMPADSRWAAASGGAHPLIGTLAVARTTEGLEETTRVWADAGGPGEEHSRAVATRARDALARIAGVGMPLIGVAFAAIGSPDLARRSTLALPPEPLALLVGPPGVRMLGADAARWTAEAGGAVVGSPRLPGALFPLGSPEGGGWERLSAVLGSVDSERLRQLLRVAPRIGAQLRDDGGSR